MSNESSQSDLQRSRQFAAANAEGIDRVSGQIDAAQGELADCAAQLADAERAFEELAAQGERFLLLQRAVDGVRQLDEAGLADQFWGELHGGAARLAAVEQEIANFKARVAALDEERKRAAAVVTDHQAALDVLAHDLFELEQERDDRLNEWVVEREATPLPGGRQVMPWTRGRAEDRQFRRVLGGSVAAAVLLGLVIPLIDLPIPERDEIIELPTRFAKLIAPPPVAAPPRPIPPEPEELAIKEPVPEEPIEPKTVAPDNVSEPAPEAEPEPVKSQGLLAFRDSFSELASDRPSTQIGAKARLRSAGEGPARPQRNLVTTLASGSSGGINLAAVSRELGGGGGPMEGVQAAHVASSISAVGGGGDRPRSGGAAAGRTDEEIQIVFDRYKAALYRLYNRELRKDPTLQGQLVLELTIEPNGSVSFIALRASNMNAPALSQQVLDRVQGFDFGAKDVPAITIVYPIDFLPTA